MAINLLPSLSTQLPMITRERVELFTNLFNKALSTFQRKEGIFLSAFLQKVSVDDKVFFGIRKDEQITSPIQSEEMSREQIQGIVDATTKKYAKIREHIFAEMGISPDAHICQIVGDSGFFSLQGTQRGKIFLRKHLTNQVIPEFGYTGHRNEEGERCVNGLVADHFCEEERLKNSIANLVGFHTPVALKNWGCSGPDMKYFVIVYGDDETSRETGTVFGDDIVTSDYMMDKLLVLEGGVQSFSQICNALLRNVKVVAIHSLRGEKTLAAIDNDGIKKTFFSGTEFLRFIQEKVKTTPNHTTAQLDAWKDEYLDPKVRLLSDPKRGDADTKRGLIEACWPLFKKMQLHMKLQNLFSME